MNESEKLFSSYEDDINFYESHIGALTPMDIQYGVTLKMLYESDSNFCRLETMRDRLRANLEKYGEEIFSGYFRGTFLASQVRELKNEIKKSAKLMNVKIVELNKLCPHIDEGFNKIAAKIKVNGEEKLMGLAATEPNINIFTKARERHYLSRYERYDLTSSDIYNFDPDGADNYLLEVLAIRKTLHKWKRQKWPKLVLDDLLMDAKDERTYELQIKFERIYLLIWKWGLRTDKFPKLARMKFKYSEIVAEDNGN